MKTVILSNQQAKDALLRGINILANTVATTLSPRGQNVAITKVDYKGNIYERSVIHDGVTVAKTIDLKDEFENMGAQILKEAAQKQVDSVGDGTTAVIILAQAIVTQAMQIIATGINPMSLRHGLEVGRDKLVASLLKLSKPVKSHQEIEYIATISSENTELGKLVAQTLVTMGKDGIVTIEESKSADTLVEHQTGMQLDHGFIHQYFVTDPAHMEAVLENARVLVTDKTIATLVPFSALLNELAAKQKPLLIIAPDITGEALALLIQNKLEGKLQALAVKAPSFGQNRTNTLLDIASVTGAKFISEEAAMAFEDVTLADLGTVQTVKANKTATILIGGRGKPKDVKERVAAIKKQITDEENEFDREKMKERLAKLTTGIAIIRVGGQTEIEMKERKERVIDAVAATKAAMDSGIVPGGEVVYLTIRKGLNRNNPSENILYQALSAPFEKLIANAGIPSAEAAVALYQKNQNWGIDVLDSQAKDMLVAGIVDPLAVPLHALKNAVSVAIQLITTDAIIIPDPPKERD